MIKKPKKSSVCESKTDLLPDLGSYLESIGHGVKIKLDGLGDLVTAVSARTGFSTEESRVVLKLLFQEIRHAMLRGDKINLSDFGVFFVSSPAVSGNIERVFAKFMPAKALLKRIRWTSRH